VDGRTSWLVDVKSNEKSRKTNKTKRLGRGKATPIERKAIEMRIYNRLEDLRGLECLPRMARRDHRSTPRAAATPEGEVQ